MNVGIGFFVVFMLCVRICLVFFSVFVIRVMRGYGMGVIVWM